MNWIDILTVAAGHFGIYLFVEGIQTGTMPSRGYEPTRAENPILFWIMGAFWLLAGIFLICYGFGLIKE